jgi:putative flippase GtrA
MLLEIERRRIPFHEVEIETVYEQGSDDHSHFRPFVDAVIIFSQLMKYAMSSILSFLVDIGIFWLSIRAFGPALGLLGIPVCTAIARAFSSFLNFNLNKMFVFRRKKAYSSHLWRYYSLAVVQMLAAAGVLGVLSHVLVGSQSAGLLTVLKMLVASRVIISSASGCSKNEGRRDRPCPNEANLLLGERQ